MPAVAPVVIAAVLAIVGCGGDGNSGASSGTTTETPSEQENRFDDQASKLCRGSAVRDLDFGVDGQSPAVVSHDLDGLLRDVDRLYADSVNAETEDSTEAYYERLDHLAEFRDATHEAVAAVADLASSGHGDPTSEAQLAVRLEQAEHVMNRAGAAVADDCVLFD